MLRFSLARGEKGTAGKWGRRERIKNLRADRSVRATSLLCVNGAIRSRLVVLATILILVRHALAIRLWKTNHAQRRGILCNGDLSRQRLFILRTHPFAPDVQHIAAVWHICNAHLPVGIGDRIQRRSHGDHHPAHLGMNVAEDVADPRTVKAPHARRPRLVEPQVEPLSFKERKYVVKEGVAIRELHHRPRRHHQQVWLETLVLLHQPRIRPLARRRRSQFHTTSRNRREPHYGSWNRRGPRL